MEGLRRSIEYFNEALRLQADYAPALAGRSLAYVLLTYYNAIPPQEGAANARASAERAIALDPESAEAYAALGQTQAYIEWRWAEADASFRRAISLDSNSAMAHGLYAAGVLMPEMRLEEAHRQFKTALDLDPLLSFANFTAAFCLLAEGRYDEAVRQYEKTIELKNIHPDMYWDYGMALGFAGRQKEAAEAFRQSRRARGAFSDELNGLESYFSGDRDKARRDAPDSDRRGRDGKELRMDVARLYAMLGEKSKALDWLEEAVRAREAQAIWIKTDPRLRSLHGDARWVALVRKVGLSP
jgi:tetratricopeptide (TPR) repeat protein